MTLHVDNDAANLLNTESILLLLSVHSGRQPRTSNSGCLTLSVHSVHHWGPHGSAVLFFLVVFEASVYPPPWFHWGPPWGFVAMWHTRVCGIVGLLEIPIPILRF